MAKIINLFNHKGGVSKTTTVFNLSWMLGLLGKRVVMADFDHRDGPWIPGYRRP
jgi:cellulose biosynthesis protein BcsQ